ncbi:MAG: DUF2975 domain-containing protein [Chlorobi bacterium]|nr:DUF2975 domain-containing protein [Chlorobiota bacterium]
METTKKHLSIKIIYWTTNILFWVFVLAAILVFGFSMGFMFKIFDETQLHVGIPVAVNVLEHGTVELNNSVSSVEFVEMYGKIHFIDMPPAIGQVYSFFLLAVLAFAFYIFFTFRKFITNVYHGVYFDLFNISLLKRISYALVGFWVFSVFYAYFQYYYLVKNMEFNSVEITGDVKTSSTVLLAALLIWVLSHIFMKGCKLQEENNYTI